MSQQWSVRRITGSKTSGLLCAYRTCTNRAEWYLVLTRPRIRKSLYQRCGNCILRGAKELGIDSPALQGKRFADQFTLGWLAAAAVLAGREEDTFVAELLLAQGIETIAELDAVYGLEQYDRDKLAASIARNTGEFARLNFPGGGAALSVAAEQDGDRWMEITPSEAKEYFRSARLRFGDDAQIKRLFVLHIADDLLSDPWRDRDECDGTGEVDNDDCECPNCGRSCRYCSDRHGKCTHCKGTGRLEWKPKEVFKLSAEQILLEIEARDSRKMKTRARA